MFPEILSDFPLVGPDEPMPAKSAPEHAYRFDKALSQLGYDQPTKPPHRATWALLRALEWALRVFGKKLSDCGIWMMIRAQRIRRERF